MTTLRPTVVLDCDPGHDDALAILVASRLTKIHAVTTVSGNAPLAATTKNAMALLELAGIEVAVSAGADRPLVAEPWYPTAVHGVTGLAGVTLPEPRGAVSESTAVERILAASREVEDLWIVATGPLTNIATAIRADPGLVRRLAGISIMGGGLGFGNTTPAAEFNFWADPEAAHIVLEAPVKIVLCGLDVTHQLLIDPVYVAGLRRANASVATRLIADLLDGFIQGYREAYFDHDLAPLHDVCAVLAITQPDLFTFEPLRVAVSTAPGVARGALIADRRHVRGEQAPNVEYATAINALQTLEEVRRVVLEL